MSEQLTHVEYEVKVYIMRTWPTGAPRGTGMVTVHVTEERSILGGMRAISAACAPYEGRVLDDVHSPELTPNPAELGWPLGTKAVAS